MLAMGAHLRITSLALFVSLIGYVNGHDSEGTDFRFGFIRNADPTKELPNQQLSITVLNGNNQTSCAFTLTYRQSYSSDPIQNTTIVNKQSFVELPIPSFYGFAYDTESAPQSVSIPNITLFANSTCPVTVIANNYDSSTGKGDSFMVLPSSFASTSFTFSLPPPVNLPEQFQYVSFLTPMGKANISLIIPDIYNGSFTADDSRGSAYIALDSKKNNQLFTYHITSDVPIQIMAGVTCAGTDIDNCDHVAYMPQKLASTDCGSISWIDDSHASEIAGQLFYADVPTSCTQQQQISIIGSQSSEVKIDPSSTTTPLDIETVPSNDAVVIQSSTSSIHVTKYFNGPSTGKKLGSYILSSPTFSQFIKGSSYFTTRNDNDLLTIACSIMDCPKLYVDGQLFLKDLNHTQHGSVYLSGVKYWIITHAVSQRGYHSLTVDNSYPYVAYVHGANQSYAYNIAINAPSVIPLPISTTTASTATTTGTTTVTTASPTTNNVTASTTPITTATETTTVTLSSSSTSSAPSSSSTGMSSSSISTIKSSTQSTVSPYTPSTSSTTSDTYSSSSTVTPPPSSSTSPSSSTKQTTSTPVTQPNLLTTTGKSSTSCLIYTTALFFYLIV